MPPIVAPWSAARLLAEDLVPVPEPLVLALRPGVPGTAAEVAGRAARALLDLPAVAPQPPPWLAPHQVPALTRLRGLIDRYGGALLADAVGLGKSYIALAVALDLAGLIPGRRPGVSRTEGRFVLVVPAVLVPQWKRLLVEKEVEAEIITHESLSRSKPPLSSRSPGLAPGVSKAGGLLIVDEAHRFRNPETLRYRRLAEFCVGRQVLLVTATPVHNRLADLFHLFRLFLRDDALIALGLGSLVRAARGEVDAKLLAAVAARLIVARSRERVKRGTSFPMRAPAVTVRAGTALDVTLEPLVRGAASLQLGGYAAPLLRLTLLRRLASSLPAFRATLARYRAFADLAGEAARSGRKLGASDFQQLFPRGQGPDLQLSLLPLMLEQGSGREPQHDVDRLRRLQECARSEIDPKAAALERLLASRGGKTIVFTDARETARYLLRRLSGHHRVAAVTGTSGWFGDARTDPQEVLAAFAPRSQRAAPPPRALATDVLIATDLVSEGLNLQDAEHAVHYDLPWSPARLAQRVGRIDRLGSPHECIATAAFLPPTVLADALDLERRLAAKVLVQRAAGAAQRETPAGVDAGGATLDWCDRLQALAGSGAGAWAHVAGQARAAVLVVRFGDHVDAIVVETGVARTDPERATTLLEAAARAAPREPDGDALDAAVRAATAVVRERLNALAGARWRAPDRDRLARRLIPWVLTAARRAAKRGDPVLLARLDQLVTRLARGMTAGEEFTVRALVERPAALAVKDLLAWHERLPPVIPWAEAAEVGLVAAVVFETGPQRP